MLEAIAIIVVIDVILYLATGKTWTDLF